MSIKLNYVYRGKETPEERIRNKIQPLFSLISILVLNHEKCKQSEELKRLLGICEQSKADLELILGDIPKFYNINPDVINVTFTQTDTVNDENTDN